MKPFSTAAILILLIVMTPILLGGACATPKKKEPLPQSQVGDRVVLEAERPHRYKGFQTSKGSSVTRPGSKRSEATYRFTVNESGKWYVWILAQGPDAANNTFNLRIDGRPLSAPPDHPYHGVTTLYLEPGEWTWQPQWQGSGSGRHQGPVTVYLQAGEHTISLVKRLTDRPIFDRIVLTQSPEPPPLPGS